jgi:NAD dependent epimerase/dehydratase family enzyme
MNEFAAAAGKALKRPSFLRAPGAVIKLAMGEKGVEMILGGVKVAPSKLLAAGLILNLRRLTRRCPI